MKNKGYIIVFEVILFLWCDFSLRSKPYHKNKTTQYTFSLRAAKLELKI